MRILGMIFILLAAVAAGADCVATNAEGFRLRDVGEVWFLIHRDSLQLAQPAVERHISPVLWDPYILTLITWPATFVLLGVGLIFWLLSRLGRGGGRVERIHPD